MKRSFEEIKSKFFECLQAGILYNGQSVSKSLLAEYVNISVPAVLKFYTAGQLTDSFIAKIITRGYMGYYENDKIFPKNIISWFNREKLRTTEKEHYKAKNEPLFANCDGKSAAYASVILECHQLAKNGFYTEVYYTRGYEITTLDGRRLKTNSLLRDMVDYFNLHGEIKGYLLKIRNEVIRTANKSIESMPNTG